jgi:hypothetical protein
MIGGSFCVIKNIISKAQSFQDVVVSRVHGWPVLSFRFYLFFVSLVFCLTGVGLFFYSFIIGVDPLDCAVLSSCFFYLMMGFLMFIVYFVMFFVLPRCHY